MKRKEVLNIGNNYAKSNCMAFLSDLPNPCQQLKNSYFSVMEYVLNVKMVLYFKKIYSKKIVASDAAIH